MGEIAEMMLDGTLCEGCGVYMPGASQGVPRRCGDCKRHEYEQNGAPFGKAKCRTCGKVVNQGGLFNHMKDAHPKEPKP